MIADVTPEPWRDAVHRGDPAEWLIELSDVGRVRCSTFKDHRGPGANFHFAFLRVVTADDLQLSAETRLLATEPDGLIVIGGSAGSDASGIPRAFGHAETPEAAYRQCVEAATAYVRGRPDTGPLSRWLFEDDGALS